MGVVVLDEDEELERIRRRKMEDLLRRRNTASEPISEPIEVTDSNFHEVVRSSRLVVIDCWAQWCAPCRMMAPIIDELAKEYAGKILFGKLNVDENPEVPGQYQIMSIPTFLVFKDGVLVDRIVGAMPKKILEQRITRYI
ncbi:MAG: thioredoxin [Candidatus Bathyarchaeia archaeon]